MNLNEISSYVFTAMTLVFGIYGFVLVVRVSHRLMRALDIYIRKNEPNP
jgi:hypothetical protein